VPMLDFPGSKEHVASEEVYEFSRLVLCLPLIETSMSLLAIRYLNRVFSLLILPNNPSCRHSFTVAFLHFWNPRIIYFLGSIRPIIFTDLSCLN
jgi:hypothetical protein